MSLLSVDDLTVHFRIRRGWRRRRDDIVHAVDGVSLRIAEGETLALVGESGCGKTTVARAILQLEKATAGRVTFMGTDLGALKPAQRRATMLSVQVVFQDPYSSLNPRMTVHDLVAEPLVASSSLGGSALEARIASLLEMVGLGTQHLWRRPHEFSGGQCQRIAIARALALEPRLLVLDEPTSALDVSVQSRVLLLLHDLQERLGLAYLLIAHDLAAVQSMSDSVAVMYLGQLLEHGPAGEVFRDPRHPYTLALLASVPSPDPEVRGEMKTLEGDVPSAVKPPSGCRFHPRCKYCMPVCSEKRPEPHAVGGRLVACHLPDDFDLAADASTARSLAHSRA